MGANQSSRKITVVNDEATGKIKLSDSVLHRLRDEISEKKSPESSPKEQPPPPTPPPPPAPEPEPAPPPPPPPKMEEEPLPPPPPPKIEEKPAEASPPLPAPEQTIEQPAAAPQQPAAAPQQPAAVPQQPPPHIWQRPIIQYIEEPSLSALKVKQEKEEEMRKLEEYWKARLRQQQDEHIEAAKLREEEFTKNAAVVQSLFKPANRKPVCKGDADIVKDCYNSNPGQTLRCREAVSSFYSCVSDARISG